MKKLMKLIFVILLTIANCFINGFVYYCSYEFALKIFLNKFLTAPNVDYLSFILLSAGLMPFMIKRNDNNYDLNGETMSKILSAWVTKYLLIIIILFINWILC